MSTVLGEQFTLDVHAGRRGRVAVGHLADGPDDLESADRLARHCGRLRSRWLVLDLAEVEGRGDVDRLVAHLRRSTALSGVGLALAASEGEDADALGCPVFATVPAALGMLGAG